MNSRRIILLIIMVLSSMVLHALTPYRFIRDEDNGYIGKYIGILKDPTGKLSFQDVVNKRSLFQKSRQDVPNLGVSDANSWVRFELENLSNATKLQINLSSSNIDDICFYYSKGEGGERSSYTIVRPAKNQGYLHQFFLFELPMKRGEKAECYIMLKSNSLLSVPISVHRQKGLFKSLWETDIFAALYIGLMLSMILYNTFLYFSTGEKHYFVYVNYIFWVAFAQLAVLGVLEQILFIQNGWLSSRLLTFSGAMSGISAIFFVKSFLQTTKDSPKLDKLLNVFFTGYVVAIILLIFGKFIVAYKIVNIVAGGGSTIVLILAFRLSRKKYRETKYFLFAWCLFLISVLVFVLKDYNILPYNFFTLRSVQIGSVFEAILLSFALGDKINIYRKEKEQSQARELAISLENEKLIREQNVILEQRVAERTHALKESNDSLQQTLMHLKEAQSQLVESEKMASLGQLTAGVAHEINNPINFVSSNVAPLKRDVNMVWETLDEVERIALTESLSVEERKKLITDYKDEVDIGYLRTEMEFLLKGMHDGAHRTAEIVKSLRIFSRVDEDTLKLADLNEGIESTLVILSSVLKEGITVETRYGDLPKVECHAGKLNQVFLNILTNAVFAINQKFQDGKGGKLTIETGLCDDMATVYIKMADNGTGIPQAVREKIFEPFFTTKDVGEGTGLGMSIAYNTIAKHHGKILLESEEGEGTLFTLIIPIQQNI